MLAREANVGDTLYFDCDDGDGLRFSGVVVISDGDGWYRLRLDGQNQTDDCDDIYFNSRDSYFVTAGQNINCHEDSLRNEEQYRAALNESATEEAEQVNSDFEAGRRWAQGQVNAPLDFEVGDRVHFVCDELGFYGEVKTLPENDSSYLYVKTTYENETGISDGIYYGSDNSFLASTGLIGCSVKSLTRVNSKPKTAPTIQEKFKSLQRRVDDFVSDRTCITTRGFFDTIEECIDKDVDAETFKKTITALYKEIDFYE